MSDLDLVVTRSRSCVERLPLLRGGFCCFAARRPGRLRDEFAGRCRALAVQAGFIDGGRTFSEDHVRLLDGPATSLIGFSWFRPARSKLLERERPVVIETKNIFCVRAVDFLVGAFSEGQSTDITDAGVVVFCRHPRTNGQEALTDRLLAEFGAAFECSRPAINTNVIARSGGYEMVLARYMHSA